MTAKEWIEYLSRFPGDDGVSIMVVDLNSRTRWSSKGVIFITDAEAPTMVLEIADPEPMDGDGDD